MEILNSLFKQIETGALQYTSCAALSQDISECANTLAKGSSAEWQHRRLALIKLQQISQGNARTDAAFRGVLTRALEHHAVGRVVALQLTSQRSGLVRVAVVTALCLALNLCALEPCAWTPSMSHDIVHMLLQCARSKQSTIARFVHACGVGVVQLVNNKMPSRTVVGLCIRTNRAEKDTAVRSRCLQWLRSWCDSLDDDVCLMTPTTPRVSDQKYSEGFFSAFKKVKLALLVQLCDSAVESMSPSRPQPLVLFLAAAAIHGCTDASKQVRAAARLLFWSLYRVTRSHEALWQVLFQAASNAVRFVRQDRRQYARVRLTLPQLSDALPASPLPTENAAPKLVSQALPPHTPSRRHARRRVVRPVTPGIATEVDQDHNVSDTTSTELAGSFTSADSKTFSGTQSERPGFLNAVKEERQDEDEANETCDDDDEEEVFHWQQVLHTCVTSDSQCEWALRSLTRQLLPRGEDAFRWRQQSAHTALHVLSQRSESHKVAAAAQCVASVMPLIAGDHDIDDWWYQVTVQVVSRGLARKLAPALVEHVLAALCTYVPLRVLPALTQCRNDWPRATALDADSDPYQDDSYDERYQRLCAQLIELIRRITEFRAEAVPTYAMRSLLSRVGALLDSAGTQLTVALQRLASSLFERRQRAVLEALAETPVPALVHMLRELLPEVSTQLLSTFDTDEANDDTLDTLSDENNDDAAFNNENRGNNSVSVSGSCRPQKTPIVLRRRTRQTFFSNDDDDDLPRPSPVHKRRRTQRKLVFDEKEVQAGDEEEEESLEDTVQQICALVAQWTAAQTPDVREQVDCEQLCSALLTKLSFLVEVLRNSPIVEDSEWLVSALSGALVAWCQYWQPNLAVPVLPCCLLDSTSVNTSVNTSAENSNDGTRGSATLDTTNAMDRTLDTSEVRSDPTNDCGRQMLELLTLLPQLDAAAFEPFLPTLLHFMLRRMSRSKDAVAFHRFSDTLSQLPHALCGGSLLPAVLGAARHNCVLESEDRQYAVAQLLASASKLVAQERLLDSLGELLRLVSSWLTVGEKRPSILTRRAVVIAAGTAVARAGGAQKHAALLQDIVKDDTLRLLIDDFAYEHSHD
ncbi:MAG: hypothetical protein MHM6MM_005428 [Cercozoa sp. M6MM]